MDAKEFYRKRLVELTPEGITKRINKIVDIEKQSQICEEYFQYKVRETLIAFNEKATKENHWFMPASEEMVDNFLK